MRWWFLVLTACGRLGFDASPIDASTAVDALDGGDDAPPVDARAIDAPAGAMTLTFGEAPLAMIMGVTRDTYLSNDVGEAQNNYGAEEELRIERDANERGLVAFDLRPIPSSAT